MSQNGLVQVGGTVLQIFTKKTDPKKRELILGAYGAGSKYGVLLPYSRSHESEADALGLMLLAKAGYNPEEASKFWNRFAAIKQGGLQPVWYKSTHPSDERRAADLQALLPQAVEHYAQAPVRYGMGEVIPTVSLASGIKPSQPDGSEIKATFTIER
jgi:predicted Zn-dependent protease